MREGWEKGREGKGREGKGREGKRRQGKGGAPAVARMLIIGTHPSSAARCMGVARLNVVRGEGSQPSDSSNCGGFG